MSTTKKQHLIWRKYLAPWTDDIASTEGNIAYYDKVKKMGKPKKSITNIGFDKYSYDISMIKDEDKKAIIAYFEKWLNQQSLLKLEPKITESPDILERDFIEKNFISPIERKGISILEKLYQYEFPFEGPTVLEQFADFLKYILFQTILTNEKLFSDEEILSLQKIVLSKFDGEDKRYDFYEFFAVQMLRTWRSKETVLKSIIATVEKYDISCLKDTSEAMFPLMMVVNSQIFATAFCKNNFYIELLRNNTSQNFITGDFPIINLCADYNNTNLPVDRLELYYPITPKIAIICKNTIKKNCINDLNDITIIDSYNKMIFDAAVKEVYACCNSKDLETYK